MNPQQLIHRGFNLLATSIVALSGFAFAPEMFVEKDIPDKIDDVLLFALGLIAIFWYKRSSHRYMRSILPVVLVALALVVKLGGLWIEIADPEAFGDDIGGVILFVLGTGLVFYQYMRTGKLLERLGNPS